MVHGWDEKGREGGRESTMQRGAARRGAATRKARDDTEDNVLVGDTGIRVDTGNYDDEIEEELLV